MKWKWLPAFLLLAVASGLIACSQPPAEAGGSGVKVRVAVTQDFGAHVISESVLEIPAHTSAMAALEMAVDVETKYGGGFVNAINGIKSGYTEGRRTKTDWFMYINGIQSDTGALDYELQDGDIEHWDFHNWSLHHFIPAVIGHFPEPFLHGFRGKVSPTLIVYSDPLVDEAGKLEKKLSDVGAAFVAGRRLEDLTDEEKGSANIILLGTADTEAVTEVNDLWRRLGFFCYFENGELVVLNSDGVEEARYRGPVGLIQATQNPWNPNGIGAGENVLWMVSGTDLSGARMAVEALIDQDKFQYAYAVLVTQEGLVKVPR
jgi:hypothetical protein